MIVDLVSDNRIRQELLPFGETVAEAARSLAAERSGQRFASLQEALLAGRDPLGELYLASQHNDTRRKNGAVYTPKAIVDSMVAWAQSQPAPSRVVDPGAGSGRFLIAAGKTFPSARLIAIEKDPAALDILRANFHAVGLYDRLEPYLDDYRTVDLPGIEGRTLFIGNPPYTRHHDIEPFWKDWYAKSCAKWGIKASKLAGLHLHFFVRTLQLAKTGDFGALITASEWIDVNYGSALRNLLVGPLGGMSLHILDPTSCPFPDAAATGAITCFQIGQENENFRVQLVKKTKDLDALAQGVAVPWPRVRSENRWSALIRPAAQTQEGFVELGELCRVHRGQVTGDNSVWIAGPDTPFVPDDLLIPAVTRASELSGIDRLIDTGSLKRVVSLPSDLEALHEEQRQHLKRFIAWARSKGADKSYTASHRRVWWQVRLGEPAPILCTYMARRPPSFVRNMCRARHINVAHGIYPSTPISDRGLSALTEYLRKNVSVTSGRTYAGGLTKFEPKELERVLVPSLEQLEA